MKHRIEILASLLSISVVAGAQSLPYCDRGPGGALGVKSYTCASCGAERKDGNGKAVYFFTTEPVIIEGALGSAFRPGDIIAAVNGKPITTREGAEEFAYPKPGKVVVAYRRGATATTSNVAQITDTITVSESCNPVTTTWFRSLALTRKQPVIGNLKVRYDSGFSRTFFRLGDSMRFELRPKQGQADPTARLGFAVSCTPSCTRATGRTGATYWKHDDYPAIVAIRSNSPAADAGLRLGDLIAEVDGKSVLDEAGALALQGARPNGPLIVVDGVVQTTEVKVIIIRDGARLERVLKIKG